jgi:hypothetical protein
MGRDEAITAIEPALAPSLERRIGNEHIAPENEVTRPRVIRVARFSANSGCTSCLSPGLSVTGFRPTLIEKFGSGTAGKETREHLEMLRSKYPEAMRSIELPAKSG